MSLSSALLLLLLLMREDDIILWADSTAAAELEQRELGQVPLLVGGRDEVKAATDDNNSK